MLLVCLFVKLNYFLSFLVNGRYDDLPRPGKVPQIVAERFKVILLLALSSLFIWGGGGSISFFLICCALYWCQVITVLMLVKYQRRCTNRKEGA